MILCCPLLQSALNPIKTSTIRKNNTCKTITDEVGTYIICKTLMTQKPLRFVTFYNLYPMNLKALGHHAGELVRVIRKMLTDEVKFNPKQEVKITYIVDLKKRQSESLIKVPYFYHKITIFQLFLNLLFITGHLLYFAITR